MSSASLSSSAKPDASPEKWASTAALGPAGNGPPFSPPHSLGGAPPPSELCALQALVKGTLPPGSLPGTPSPESASLASCPCSGLMHVEDGVLILSSCLWNVAAPALPCFLASPASAVTMASSGLSEPHKILLLLKCSAGAGGDSQGHASGPAPAGESARRPDSSLSCHFRWDSRETTARV